MRRQAHSVCRLTSLPALPSVYSLPIPGASNSTHCCAAHTRHSNISGKRITAMIITMANTKGGAGKTTVMRALAGHAAHIGIPVTVYDCDTSENATR
ncbi:ParA family protein [Brucella intermedia]|nr:ParA family protein [Brucella intermedia]